MINWLTQFETYHAFCNFSPVACNLELPSLLPSLYQSHFNRPKAVVSSEAYGGLMAEQTVWTVR